MPLESQQLQGQAIEVAENRRTIQHVFVDPSFAGKRALSHLANRWEAAAE